MFGVLRVLDGGLQLGTVEYNILACNDGYVTFTIFVPFVLDVIAFAFSAGRVHRRAFVPSLEPG